METITFRAMPPDIRATWTDRVMRVIIPVSAVIGLFLLLGFYQPEAEDKRILAAIIFLFGLAGGLRLVRAWRAEKEPPASGTLLLDDEGLTWRHTSWRWRELSAFEFCDLGPNRRFIWFHVAEDPQSSEAYRERARVAPGRSERRITGRFDVPLEDIAARLNDMRRRALGGAAEDEAARRLPAAGPAGTARVIFADAERNGTTAGLIVALVLVIIFGVDVLAVNSWIRWPILAFLAVAAIPVVLRLRVLLTGEGKPAPADNCLALNGEGLTVTRRGRTTTWSWREISPFRARATGPIGRVLQCGFIVATVPDDARLSRFWRLAGRLLFRRPALVIADKYLARPEVIAATLNEYRERALGGGTKTDSPHAPTT